MSYVHISYIYLLLAFPAKSLAIGTEIPAEDLKVKGGDSVKLSQGC